MSHARGEIPALDDCFASSRLRVGPFPPCPPVRKRSPTRFSALATRRRFGSFDAMRYWLRAAVGFLLALATACAEPLPVGRGRIEVPLNGTSLTLFTYKTAAYKDGPLLVVFHGPVAQSVIFAVAWDVAIIVLRYHR